MEVERPTWNLALSSATMNAMVVPSYPVELEQWWLDQARNLTGIREMAPCLASLEKDAERLSDLFTLERAPRFGEYARDGRMLFAYGLFFFPQTFVRVQLVLDELAARCPPSLPPRRILDLGCGSGAASFAALTHFRESPVEVLGIDASGAFLDIMKRVFEGGRALWPDATLRTQESDILSFKGDGPWDLVLVSFALNEAMESRPDDEARAWLRRWLDRLSDGGRLVILEPVSRTTSERLERLRDWVAEEKLARIVGPCLHHAPCPLLGKADVWCHEVRRWRIPETLAILNRRLHRSIEDLKFSYIALERSDAPGPDAAGPELFRMIAPMRKLKGKLVTAGCAADGGARTYEMLSRGLNREEEDALTAVERGTVLRAADLKPLADGRTLRVGGMERVK